MNQTDSFAIGTEFSWKTFPYLSIFLSLLVHFPQHPKLTANDMRDIQFDTASTTIKTADLTYEGQRTKSSELCGILGFVDDQGHIHLSSNFDLYTMRPKLTDFNSTLAKDSSKEVMKLEVRVIAIDWFRH